MCRTEAEGGRRCARANESRSYRNTITQRLARNKRRAADETLDPDRRAIAESLVARDELILGVLKNLIHEHGEVVTPTKDDEPAAAVNLKKKLPADTLMTPVAPLPTVVSNAPNRHVLRKFARTAGKITAEADGAVYVRTDDGSHLRLTNEKTRPVYTCDGVRVNLLGMVVDPNHAVDSRPETQSLYLTAINLDHLRGNADASLRGVAMTASRVRGISKPTMDALRENEGIISDASDKQRRRTWLDIANGDRPDRAFANLRLAHLEGAYPGLSERNDAHFRSGARALATTMQAGNVQPTMRAEMLAGYTASAESSFDRKEAFIAGLVKEPTGRQRALFYSNTEDASFVTEPNDVEEMAQYAHSIGTTIRERCYVATAMGHPGGARMLRAAEDLGLADGTKQARTRAALAA